MKIFADTTSGSVRINEEVSEALALQREIRDMELELARIKATHPPDNVSSARYFLNMCDISDASQRLTINQASELLDEQIAEIQRLTDTLDTTSSKVDKAREEVAAITKEVSCLLPSVEYVGMN